MSEQDRKPQPKDRVRVIFEGVADEFDDHGRLARVSGSSANGAWLSYVPENATVEVLAPETCGATEGATGIACGLLRWHSLPIDHEGTHEPDDKQDSVGYRLFVRWPWNHWDKDYADVMLPRPDATREPRVFPCPGPQPPQGVRVKREDSDLVWYADDRNYMIRVDNNAGLSWGAMVPGEYVEVMS